MNKETDFYIVNEADNEVLYFETEEALTKFFKFNEGTPVFVRPTTQDDLN